jgi:chromate transport protein ChrA
LVSNFPAKTNVFPGIFGPGMVLIAGFFPFYVKYRQMKLFKDALVGINAAAIGLVIAAVFLLYNRAVQGKCILYVNNQ